MLPCLKLSSAALGTPAEVPGVKTLEYVRAEDQLPDHATPPNGALDPKKLVGSLVRDRQGGDWRWFG